MILWGHWGNDSALPLDNGEAGPRKWVGDMPAPAPVRTPRPAKPAPRPDDFLYLLHYRRTYTLRGERKEDRGTVGPIALTLLVGKYPAKVAQDINRAARLLTGKGHGDRVLLNDVEGFHATDKTEYRLEKHDPRPIEEEV